MNDIERHFHSAVHLFRTDRLPEAEQLCRRIIASVPGHSDALHLLGVVVHKLGRNDEAADWLLRSLAIHEANPEAHYNLGTVLHELGRLDEAVSAFRQAISLSPNYDAAHNNLGASLEELGRFDEAIAAFQAAVSLKPNDPIAHTNLGNVLGRAGRIAESLTAHRRAISLNPTFATAHFNLANALRAAGREDEAAAARRRALDLDPRLPRIICNNGSDLCVASRFEEAAAAFRQAIALDPHLAAAHSNLGHALREMGRFDEAIAACRDALVIEPDFADAHHNLGVTLVERGQIDEGIAAFRQALSLQPDNEAIHLNLAEALLSNGNFDEGWKEYEWRWKMPGSGGAPTFSQPHWRGEPLDGRTILILVEQGFGDMFQFLRYLPLVAERGGKIVVGARPDRHRLIRAMPGAYPTFEAIDRNAFACHCPLLSLPRVFRTTVESIPRNVPYLFAEPAAVGQWRDRLAEHAPCLKVGLTWAGRPTHGNDRNRSMRLSDLAPLADCSNVRFFSLQKGPAAAQTAEPPRGMRLIDLTSELHDFADTAALIANLDLVFSVDTSTAHLAGAMNKPVWTMLPASRTDWRWLRDREDSPWYPSMRLFRQTAPGDWAGVASRVAEALADFAAERLAHSH